MPLEKENIMAPRTLWIAMFVFTLISAIGICNHELWLDEAQHYLIARDSNSIGDLYYNMRYDGHVRLWNGLLFFITHYISANPLAMQLFHLIIICSCVFIFLKYAPFDTITKILIIFGYYFIFEYNVISRNYSLGILFLFITCTLIGYGNNKSLWISVLLLLMCNTHLFFAFAATGIFIYISYINWQQKSFDLKFYVLAVIYCIAILGVIIQMKMPPDSTVFHPEKLRLYSVKQLYPAAYAFSKGFFPIPVSINGNFWNHYYFDSLPRILKAVMAIVLFLYPFLLLRKSKSATLFYFCSVTPLLIFVCVSSIEASRYYGMVFIFFIAAAWLAGIKSKNIFSFEKIRIGHLKTKLFYGFFYCILIGNLFCGVYAIANTVNRPFTDAKKAAQYIKTNNLDSELVVVAGYWPGPSLSAYLGKKVFYLNIDEQGSYLYWKKSYFEFTFRPLVQQLSQSTYVATKSHFIFVCGKPVPSSPIMSGNYIFQFTLLDSFTRAMVIPHYYIYRLNKKINTISVSEKG